MHKHLTIYNDRARDKTFLLKGCDVTVLKKQTELHKEILSAEI